MDNPITLGVQWLSALPGITADATGRCHGTAKYVRMFFQGDVDEEAGGIGEDYFLDSSDANGTDFGLACTATTPNTCDGLLHSGPGCVPAR